MTVRRAAVRQLGLALAAAVIALPVGCVRIQWTHQTRHEPIVDASWADLEPDRDTLAECLNALGAPNRVWETGTGNFAIAYWWWERSGWSIQASYEVVQFASASFSYDSEDVDRQGVVLIFDDTWHLQSVRNGLIREIAPGERRRPVAAVD